MRHPISPKFSLSLFFLLLAVSTARAQVVAHWAANGTTDDVVGGNNGTFQGAAMYGPGEMGQAFQFDGTNYIVVPDSPSVSPTGQFTIEAWIKPNFNNSQQGIVEKYVTPGTNGFFLRIASSRLQFGICGANLQPTVASGFTPVTPGVWHHVVAISDSTNVRVYLDGVMDAYTAHGGVTATDGPTSLKIGARGDDANTRFNGAIDEIKIYNTALPLPIPSNQHVVADGDVGGLIAAINLSNATPGPDTINLAQNGNYVLTYVAGPDSYHGATGLPIVQGSSATSRASLTINGNGSTIQRSDSTGTPEFRIIYALYSNLILDSVTLKNGVGRGSIGGGGGLYMNVSDVLLKNSTITANVGYEGGGIFNTCGALTIENSTISYNIGLGGRTGGGILNFGGCPSPLKISNSTIYENSTPGSGRGNAIADAFTQQNTPNSILIKNSILASPTQPGDDCIYFVPVSLGHNIFSDATCGQNVPGGDMIIPNVTLESLANNGGLTPTHALPAGSAAIDAIPVADCTNTAGVPVAADQRGTTRPIGAGCDVGAVEQDPFDTTPPSITPTVTGIPGSNGWYISNVSVSWAVTDGESDVSSSSGCDSASVTSDTSGITFTCTATSGGGNASDSVTVKRDASAPSINIIEPTARTYLLNQTAIADFTCSDALSGTASCTGTTASGSSFDTSSVGAKTFTVSSTDDAGNSASATVNYEVGYGMVVLFDQTKAHKSGSTVPIKIQLVDATGANVSSSATVVHAISVVQISSQASTTLDDSGNSNPDFDFRYDASFGGYIFNLKTTGYGTGSYLLNFIANGNPQTYSVSFQVRQ